MTKTIDFTTLKDLLRGSARDLLPRWFPAGRVIGNEFKVGNVLGEAGDSLAVSLTKGLWKDFASGESGDMIDLYAASRGLSVGDAGRELADLMGTVSTHAAPPPPAPKRRVIIPVPDSAPRADHAHSRHGPASTVWTYRDGSQRLLGYVCRYDTPDGKEIVPQTFTQADGEAPRWTFQQWPEPRPLYGLDRLAARPDAPVLLVEGEKAADAADRLAPFYVAVTWPGGCQAWHKCGWQALKGRDVLMWPDADTAGAKAMTAIAEHLQRIGARRVRIIDTAGQPDGWDAADAVAEGWDFDRLVAWAKPRAKLVAAAPTPPEQRHAPSVPRETSPQQSTRANVTDLATARAEKLAAKELPAIPFANLRQMWEELGLECQGNGRPLQNESNVMKILTRREEFKDLLWYDTFLKRFLTHRTVTGKPSAERHEWCDAHTIWLAIKLQADYGMAKVTVNTVQHAMVCLARSNGRNEVADWLNGLVWDGEPRVDAFLSDIFGAADTPYTRAAGKNFWVSLVKRALDPPCKVDNMLVLEGAQGVGKSTALRIIGGKYFAEAHESVMSTNFYIALQGKLLIEIGEMDAFNRSEVSKVKGVISNQTDRFREPYARTAQDWDRQCIFVGTTNRDDWNRDETGARRFWPVRCSEINLAALRDLREQYFAEAVSLMRDSSTWWLMPAVDTKAQQEHRRAHDEWEPIISDLLLGRTEATIRWLLVEGLKFETNEIDQRSQNRVARCLTALGWERFMQRSGTTVQRVYRRKSTGTPSEVSDESSLEE